MDASNSMNSKLIADYVELANQHLDNLPIESLEEFDMTVIALKKPSRSHQKHSRIAIPTRIVCSKTGTL